MFSSDDKLLLLNELSPFDVAKALTLDDVEHFLLSLGVPQENIEKTKTEIRTLTICHNPLSSAESMKLYWYDNTKLFHCYTECNDNFSIFELYRKFMYLNYESVSFEEAVSYVKKFLTNIAVEDVDCGIEKDIIRTIPRERYQSRRQIKSCEEYNKNALDCFVKNHYPTDWLREGISKKAMDKFDIRFSIYQNKIVIPHLDLDGRLIGIRARALNPEEIELGKYRPIWIGDTEYRHPLSYNLYGLYENKEALKKYKRAIIVEGEKSVLKGYDFYGDDSIIVACCGLNFGIYQLNLLTRKLGVNEVIFGFDKEYNSPTSEEGKKWRNKNIELCNKYKDYAHLSYIYDDVDLLDKKDSPLDKGKKVFELLYNRRKKVS